MHKFVFHNDRVLPLTDVRLSPGQAGLFNGWGLFTTIRLYDGRPFAFERHWKRLRNDAERIKLPMSFSPERVRENLCEVIRANRVGDGCARIYFIYNRVGIWCSDEPFPLADLVIYTTDLPVREGAVRLAVREQGRHAGHPLAGTKVTSWLQNVWSLEQAQARGFDEVILLNEHGQVAECTSANLFWVREGSLETPPLAAGCLAGVTREILLEIAPSIGVPVRECTLPVEELLKAEEIVVTSTTREVQPVGQIENHQLPHAPGPLTQRLARAFSEFVTRTFSQQPQRSEVQP